MKAENDRASTKAISNVPNRRSILLGGSTLAAASAFASAGRLRVAQAQQQAAAQQPTQKPNVIFILADNVGYGDMGPYGGGKLRGMPTPRTDELAREGLRLTQFLVEPSCTPSRAALMTGQYSIRNGLSLATVPGTPNTLSGNAYTMGQLFKDAGYATAIFGKWHLGIEPQTGCARFRRVLWYPARHFVGRCGDGTAHHADALDRCA
jgi:arylsulfatase A-like enzyme